MVKRSTPTMAKTTKTDNLASAAELSTKLFPTAQAWEQWLDANHGRSRGVWLKIAKPRAGVASVGYSEALEAALLFGWIDGQKQKYDEHFWLQKFTPRGTRSRWSERNRAIATRLMKEGRMRPAGLAAVEGAKNDGRWAQAYASQGRATVPPICRVPSRPTPRHLPSSLPSIATTGTRSFIACTMRRSPRRAPGASLTSSGCWRVTKLCTRRDAARNEIREDRLSRGTGRGAPAMRLVLGAAVVLFRAVLPLVPPLPSHRRGRLLLRAQFFRSLHEIPRSYFSTWVPAGYCRRRHTARSRRP